MKGKTTKKRAPFTAVEESYLKCPDGHTLPHHTDQGNCSPVYCAGYKGGTVKAREAKQKKRLSKSVMAKADGVIEAMLPEDDAREIAREAKGDEAGKLAMAVGRLAARKAFSKVPDNLEGAEAEEWAQKFATSRLPIAMAELDYQLQMGDDKQRQEAARDFLDINGMRKRESTNGGGATIILNLGGKELPWAQKVVEKLAPGTIDVKPTKE